jgi:hypothetical protein
VAKYLGAHCVAAHQQVGSFEVINEHGVLAKNGGNVASYFCTPDGRVVHAVTGPVDARQLLAEARWAVETYRETRGDSARLAEAHRTAARGGMILGRNGQERRIHGLLSEPPLPALNDVYRTIFENILGQRVSAPDDDLVRARTAFAAAARARLPLLVILHKEWNNAAVLRQWSQMLEDVRYGATNPFASLARSYVVVTLPLNELPALSGQLGIPPYAAPDRATPLFVVARSNGRQLTSVTGWQNRNALLFAMAQGLVQEAKEHTRSRDQLRTLFNQVKPLDFALARQVQALHAESKPARPRPASAHARRS